MARILAIGGGGFLMEDGIPPIDTYIRQLSGAEQPKVCFIPTASGDSLAHIEKFYSVYESLGCIASHRIWHFSGSHCAMRFPSMIMQLGCENSM